MREQASAQLKQACRLSGAAWAAHVGTRTGGLVVISQHGLRTSETKQLEKWLESEAGWTWYRVLPPAGRSIKRLRRVVRPVPQRVCGYRLGEGHCLMVCVDGIGKSEIRVWDLVAELWKPGRGTSGTAAELNLRLESAYDSQRGLESILAAFLIDSAESGWLAIRRGDVLAISAERNGGPAPGTSFNMVAEPLLGQVHRTHRSVAVHRGSPDWARLPHPVPDAADTWIALPLISDDRFIGAVAIWSAAELSKTRQQEATRLAEQVARSVDQIVSLGEVTTQLQRLATLNEFALAISSAEALPEMARRVLEHLGSLYPSHLSALYVPTLNGLAIDEFQLVDSELWQQSASWDSSPVSPWFGESAQAFSLDPMGRTLLDSDGRVRLFLPLRYRSGTVGVLELTGPPDTRLSRYDRSLLAVVATYMAGVVEHGRLRAEALDRAMRLEETVQQLREAELQADARLRAQQTAESRLVQAAKLAAVGEMAAGVAHELNNPLTTVSGFAELLLDETPANAPYRADLEMVLHEAHRARSVVRHLLDFARQGEHARARADVNELIQDVLALMTHFIHTSGVQLEVGLAPDLPWITLDGNQMKQVLLNLLHNALHAMPGGGRLQVRTLCHAREEHDWVIIEVGDNGVGMDPTEIGRIFDPFYTTRAESGGTGLGLSVTYGIVTDHGGTIEVQSERGKGSTFSVWLPA